MYVVPIMYRQIVTVNTLYFRKKVSLRVYYSLSFPSSPSSSSQTDWLLLIVQLRPIFPALNHLQTEILQLPAATRLSADDHRALTTGKNTSELNSDELRLQIRTAQRQETVYLRTSKQIIVSLMSSGFVPWLDSVQ